MLGLLLSLIVASGVLERARAPAAALSQALARRGLRRPSRSRCATRCSGLEGRSLALEISEAEETALVGSAFVPWVEAGSRWWRAASWWRAAAGPLWLNGLKVTTQWPFGLFAKSRVFAVEDQLLIFPRRGFLCEVPPDSAGTEASDRRRSAAARRHR